MTAQDVVREFALEFERTLYLTVWGVAALTGVRLTIALWGRSPR